MKQTAAAPVEVLVFTLDSDEEKRQDLYRILSADEKRRAGSFRFDKHRNRFITGRGKIRQILGEKAKCAPQAIEFDLNKYGKPSLSSPNTAQHLEFNASSSAVLGAIAISDRSPVGLDIEKIKPMRDDDYDRIVMHEFTADECRWYMQHARHERNRVFFEFWTCKEAYLKALGIGLSGKLDGFSIDLSGRNPLVSHTELEDCGQSAFSLYRLNIANEFIGCLASEIRPDQINLSKSWASTESIIDRLV